jgi:hypothetical protein
MVWLMGWVLSRGLLVLYPRPVSPHADFPAGLLRENPDALIRGKGTVSV